MLAIIEIKKDARKLESEIARLVSSFIENNPELEVGIGVSIKYHTYDNGMKKVIELKVKADLKL